MTDTKAPERVWVCEHMGEYGNFYPEAVEAEGEHGGTSVEYVRADLLTAAEALAARDEQVRAEERELCAKVADSHKPPRSLLIDAGANSYWRGVDENSHSIAAAIRARGET